MKSCRELNGRQDWHWVISLTPENHTFSSIPQPSGAQFSRVLDFGAGSLRETFELSLKGFDVVSLDLSEATMRAYYADYDWTDCSVQPTLIAGGDLS